jgi:murein DD-endopeptidase MepM/ murein hydrolase activator NlpD
MKLSLFVKKAIATSKTFLSEKSTFVKTIAATLLASTLIYAAQQPSVQSFFGFQKNQPMSVVMKPKNLKYGIDLDSFQMNERKIGANESLGHFLSGTGLTSSQIDKINRNCDSVFNVRTFRTGKEYAIMSQNNEARFFCYAPDPYSNVVIDLKTLEAKKVQLPVETRIEMSSGIVESNLWNTMEDNGWSLDMIDKLEDALKCAVDFHHINEGDKFKLIYEQHYIEGKAAGTGKLLAGYFTDGNKEYHAVWYENGDIKGFFDAEGRPMKKTFLKSPVKFAHISSGFNMKRLHPVLRYVKPHLGTDFAASHGTPIMAVADGRVEEATRRGGNGIFVKLRHDGTYETQYLHMSAHAKGIHPGVRVTQGQVIGYVGSTGLATGPHVCFRFWKNGEQINFLKANLPAPSQMDKKVLPEYLKFKDNIVSQLATIEYKNAKDLNKGKNVAVAP